MDARATAVRVLFRVIGQGVSLTKALSIECCDSSVDRAFIQELSFGTLRWHERLAKILHHLLHKPLKRRNLDVECLLKLGLYQLIYMRLPVYAVMHSTVQATEALSKSWAKGLVNATLRSFLRQKNNLLERSDGDPTAQLSHPLWLIKRLQLAYPQCWQEICNANNQQAPMTLRINQRVTDAEHYIEKLHAAGFAADRHCALDSAVILSRATSVEQLPGFEQGVVTVQDGAAQLAAYLIDCQPGMRVLDACAAPGGKTAHILESVNGDVDLLAVEIDAARIKLLRQTLDRLGWTADICQEDASRPDQWWDGRAYDRILLDAPCSGSGVIRRHPDIKLLRRASDIAALQRLQYRLLKALWPLVAERGMLLYATCSILPEENSQLIDRLLHENIDMKLVPPNIDWAGECEDGWQIQPGQMDMDGFYYACLRKQKPD